MKALRVLLALGLLTVVTTSAFAALPAPPTNVIASDGTYDNCVQVSWAAVVGATHYQVWRDANYTGANRTNLASITATSFTDTATDPATFYYYWIISQNNSGTSTWSVTDFGYRNLSMPTGVSASAGTDADAVKVIWSAVSNAVTYEVYRSTANNFVTALMITETTAMSYSDATTVPGGTYYYWIKAKREMAQGLVCRSSASAGCSGWKAMSTPQNLRASNGSYMDKIRVTWSATPGATGYEVWRNPSPSIGLASKINDTTAISYDDENVIPPLVYYYWVRAKSPNGMSAFSSEAAGYRATNSIAIPTTPAAVMASDGTYPDRVRVQWSGVANANSYEIWRNIFNYLGTAEWMANSVGTRYEDFAIADNTLYYYWVRAENTAGVSGYSIPDSGYRMSTPAPHPSVISSNVVNDYNGDRASDMTILGVSNAAWNAKSISNTVTLNGIAWGGSEMTPVPGDYNGDRISDLAVYHEASGTWYVRTPGGAVLFWGQSWGAPGYVPVRGDYDGDGRADFALYNVEQGHWCILSANGTVIAWMLNFGASGLNPVPGDYDGDGRFDLALFDSTLDKWYVMTIAGQVLVWDFSWGNPGSVPVPGDYNGDGVSDMAVYNTIAGYWYIRTVYGSILVWEQSWGGPVFRPVGGDFNADGYSDLAVYGEFNGVGVWYIMSVDGKTLAWNMSWGGRDSKVIGLAE